MNKVVRFRSPEQFRRAHTMPAAVPQRRPLRRVEPPVEDTALAPTEDELKRRISEELDFAWRQLELTVALVSRDALTVARHGAALRTVDAVGQTLGQLAVILRSSRPEQAVDLVPSTDLRGRLQGASRDRWQSRAARLSLRACQAAISTSGRSATPSPTRSPAP